MCPLKNEKIRSCESNMRVKEDWLFNLIVSISLIFFFPLSPPFKYIKTLKYKENLGWKIKDDSASINVCPVFLLKKIFYHIVGTKT